MAGVTVETHDGRQAKPPRPPRKQQKQKTVHQQKRSVQKGGFRCSNAACQRIGKQEQNRASYIAMATAADGYDRSTSGQCAERPGPTLTNCARYCYRAGGD